MRRVGRRWATPFGSWVSEVGVSGVVERMERAGFPTTSMAVYHWVSGTSLPRIEHAAVIVRESCGRVSLDDIVAQRMEAAGCQQTVKRG